MMKQQPIKKHCRLCAHNVIHVDYKDVQTLRRFISSYGKITPRRRNGLCASHQRKTGNAIKNARIMALLPFVVR